MKTVAILAVIGIAAAAFFALSSGPSSEVESEFRSFLDTYRVGYGTTEEYSYRLKIFQENLVRIDELNNLNPEATFAINQFGDRTPEEMSKLMGYVAPAHRVVNHVPPTTAESVDWTNMWSSVKNQGSCGSCWAFSAAAAFEARSALSKGFKTVQTLYSEQQLVDCDTQSEGCNGGFMDYAFEYLEKNGFCTGAQYPYVGRDQTCRASALCASGPTDGPHANIPHGNENNLLERLATGPISVAVDASTWSFYRSGIMSNCKKNLNHGVTLVKYNPTEGSITIRNSWGGSWGESGLIRLKTGQDTCGYADDASFPTF